MPGFKMCPKFRRRRNQIVARIDFACSAHDDLKFENALKRFSLKSLNVWAGRVMGRTFASKDEAVKKVARRVRRCGTSEGSFL